MISNLLKRRYFLYKYRPSKIRIEASTICQLRCSGCSFQNNNHDNLGGGFLRFDNFKKLIDNNTFIREVELSNWGEIFLNPELVDIMRYANEKGVSLTAYNGCNFNTVSEAQLNAMVDYSFKVIQLSIDGASQESYAKYRIGGNFDNVIDNIKKLIAIKKQKNSNYPQIRWQYVINEYNELEVGKAKEIASKLGIPIYFKLNWDRNYIPKNTEYLKAETKLQRLTRDEIEQIIKSDYLGEIICGNMFHAPQINWNGDLLGCCEMTFPPYKINVFETSLEDALKSEEFMKAKECLLTLHPSKDKFGSCVCFNCQHRKTREQYGKVLNIQKKKVGKK